MTFPIMKGKTVIITGASSGMGKATALLFAKAKANVVLASRNEVKANEVVKEIKSFGGEAIFIKTDISNSEQVAALVESTVTRYGKLDCAVNNAAMAPDDKAIVDFDEDYWDKLMKVDLKGTAICLKYEMRQMAKQENGGSIVNIASAITQRAQPNSCAYVAAKQGVLGLTEVASLEGGPNIIRVNSVCPGTIETPMLNQFIVEHNFNPDEWAKATTTLGRFAQPEEVAEASMWLCSDAASYVSGANFVIDGGYARK